MSMPHVELNVGGRFSPSDIYNAKISSVVLEDGYYFTVSTGQRYVSASWEPPFHFASIADWGSDLDSTESENSTYYAHIDTKTLAVFTVQPSAYEEGDFKVVSVRAYSKESTEHAQTWMKEFAEKNFIPGPQRPEPEDDYFVDMGFYYFTGNGAKYREKSIGVHPWIETKRNYVPEVQGKMEALLTKKTIKEEDGKLLLIHGAPGGGKTHLIRTLAYAWQDWARFEIIIDPENFLGRAEYMLEIVMDSFVDNEIYRILVLEDSGEFIAKFAKERTGQGMSRLLNMADGLLGQGQNLGFCITTNEDISALEDSVTRPGRCLSQIEVPSFDADQASKWLGYESGGGNWMLADLYSTKNKSLANMTKGSTTTDAIGQYL
jgi:hypothetical protein